MRQDQSDFRMPLRMLAIGFCAIALLALSSRLPISAKKRESAHEVPLPSPPAGFSWKRIPVIKAAFLMPDNWFYKETKKGGTLGYFMTAEDIDKVGRFDTGLSLNVFRKMKDRDATTQAKEFIDALGQKNELLESWETDIGSLHGFGCQVRIRAEGSEPATRVHYLAVASKTTNTLYILFFEAPDESWESAWKVGQTMLEVFVLDDEV